MKKAIDYLFEDKRTFAKGVCKEKLLFVFLFGCVFGCIYEELLYMFGQYQATGTLQWVTRRGLIYGELSPVYGFGFVIAVYFLMRKERAWYKNYFFGALIGGGFEYFSSFIQETFTSTVSWDYTGYLLNLNGRTTIPFMLVWGIMGLLIIYVFYPFISMLVEKIPYNLGMILYQVLLILVTIDLFISFGAAIRQMLRRYGYRAYSPFGKFFDKFDPDERLMRIYTNSTLK